MLELNRSMTNFSCKFQDLCPHDLPFYIHVLDKLNLYLCKVDPTPLELYPHVLSYILIFVIDHS